jgi:hypothetical protein
MQLKIKVIAANRIILVNESGICISLTDTGKEISIQRQSTSDSQTADMKLNGDYYNYEAHFSNDQSNAIIDADILRIK